FNKLLITLGLSVGTETTTITPETALVQRIAPQIEADFDKKDWHSVISKADFLSKHAPAAVPSAIYHLQGLALFEEGDAMRAREALNTALSLVSDRTQRLILLKDYTDALISLAPWMEVLR